MRDTTGLALTARVAAAQLTAYGKRHVFAPIGYIFRHSCRMSQSQSVFVHKYTETLSLLKITV